MGIELTLRCDRVPVEEALLQRLAAAIFAGEGEALRVSLCVVDDAESRRVNREFLDHDWATDVIAFDLRGDEDPGGAADEDVDGELVVNAEQAVREAAERAHGPEAELLFYVAHGLLHLLGYDDGSADERDRMMRLQTRYLAAVGVVIAS